MRIILVVPRFPQRSETFIVNKFVGLTDAGWDVHIVCQQGFLEDWANFPALSERQELYEKVHRQLKHDSHLFAAITGTPALIATALRAPRETWDYWRKGWQLFGWRTLKQFFLDATIVGLAPDILHFEFGTLAADRTYLKDLLDCNLSVSFRGYDSSFVGLENPEYYEEVWEQADALHLLGNDLWRRALTRGCPPDMPHALIPAAIDVDFFDDDTEEREPVPISLTRPFRILSVARLEWSKGYEYALEAACLLRERGVPFIYHIIGDGSYLEPLAFARHQLGLEEEVVFLGAQTQREVIEAMKWADVFLHASVSEGFGNAVLEAQAMRLPVVTSDADGLSENVADGETGFVVPRRSPQALAEKLALLAQDGDLRRAMGSAGRERVSQHFQLGDQLVAFDEFYRSMAGAHAR